MTPNKEKALACLMVHKTKKEAAEAAGITDRTLRTYFDDPEFRRRYKEAFGDIVEEATREAQRILSPAFSVLKEIMEDTEVNPAARTQAAKGAIEYALRISEHTDILEQLRELERGDL